MKDFMRLFASQHVFLNNNSRTTERILKEVLMSSFTGISERVPFVIKIGRD
jgi:hypothetical protein